MTKQKVDAFKEKVKGTFFVYIVLFTMIGLPMFLLAFLGIFVMVGNSAVLFYGVETIDQLSFVQLSEFAFSIESWIYTSTLIWLGISALSPIVVGLLLHACDKIQEWYENLPYN